MRVIGIDPGLNTTGYGLIERDGDKFIVLDSGEIKSGLNSSLSRKLCTIYNKLVDVLNKWDPDELAIEDLYVNVNAKSALKLGHARGVAMLACEIKGVKIYEYSPRELKKAVTGFGGADKNQIQCMIKILLNSSSVYPAHVSDALAVAICHMNSRKFLNYK